MESADRLDCGVGFDGDGGFDRLVSGVTIGETQEGVEVEVASNSMRSFFSSTLAAEALAA